MNERFSVLVIEHERDAGIALLGRPLEQAGVVLETVGPGVGRAIPDSLAGFAGIIVLGGEPGPLDDAAAPWLPAVRERMAEALAQSVPMLGVCLGSELLTVVAGGQVVEAGAGPEIGVRAVQFLAEAHDDPLFSVLGSRLNAPVPAVQWHYLESAVLPAAAVHLASSDRSEYQAYRIADAAWGVQFHPEALADALEVWGQEDHRNLAEQGRDARQIVAQAVEMEPELREVWAPLGTRFAEIVRHCAGSGQPG